MIKLGQKVKDRITGLEGIVIARTEWLYGCVRITIQPEMGKDGKPAESFTIDEPQTVVVADGLAAPEPSEEPKRNHGDRPSPSRKNDPAR